MCTTLGSCSFFKQSRPTFPAGSCFTCLSSEPGQRPHAKDSQWPASTLANHLGRAPSERPSSFLSPVLCAGPDIFLPTQISSFVSGPMGRKAWLLPLEPELNLSRQGWRTLAPLSSVCTYCSICLEKCPFGRNHRFCPTQHSEHFGRIFVCCRQSCYVSNVG